ncbi:proton-coupled amino acid transporter-like protein pathetic isoform X2 [Photinus pyralis]|uniref:proton-coupled amino acid transporter-like protein pathetic isoform X2 n=1 Tax=Photinus pyralis TaxID=7054 RepID=UPI00126760E1|nr:proton-coupled amino acid transporter-like protein pathetic isoform X2 [Photinus pyralis]
MLLGAVAMSEPKGPTVPGRFSSTAKLGSSEVSIPVDSKTLLTQNDDYNPFEHRNVEHPNSTVGALIHLLKSSLGTGILAMPVAFRNAGLLGGAIGTFCVGFLCTYCVHMLVSASHEICKRARLPSLGLAETCGAAFEYGPKPLRRFGTAVRIAVDIGLVITTFMVTGVYVVFMSNSLQQLMEHWVPGTAYNARLYMVMLMLPLMISSQVRELKHLVPYSFLANICMVTSFAISLYYLFMDIPDPSSRPLFSSIGNLPLFFSTVLFAMEGIGVVMPVENTMKKPQHFLGCPGVLNGTMGIVVVLYAMIGFFGYLKYGDATEGTITLNFPVHEIPAQILKLLIVLSVFFTYNLQLYVALEIIWKKVDHRIVGRTKRNVSQVIARCVYVAGTVAIAAAVPNLEHIIGLVGSICLSILGVLLPAIIETVVYWEHGFGCLKWRLIKNIFLAVLALFALVSGSMESIRALF